MLKKKNKGFSMVEIIISIAIFAILMIPIVSALISSMKNTTKAKNLQYRNDYAENLMEYVKQDSLDNIMGTAYFSSIGSSDVSAVKSTGEVSVTGSTKKIPYENYTISGKVKLGTKHTKYSYQMEISNQYYAEKEATGSYINPNNLALGIVEDIDYTKVALIPGTIANYDTAVTNAFLTKKVEILKKYDPDLYEAYVKNQTYTNLFGADSCSRIITIRVEGNKDDGYMVYCDLKYHDNSELTDKTAGFNMSTYLKDVDIEYTPYATAFKELPNIYLMYNTCLYNKHFADNDYIVFDNSGVTDDTPVNIFVVETAERYSGTVKDVLSADSSTAGEVDNVLYNDNVLSAGDTRKDVNVYMAATSSSKLTNLSIYHNFDNINTDSLSDEKKKEFDDRLNKKNENLKLLDLNAYLTGLGYQSLLVTKKDGRLTVVDTANSANVAALNEAKQENRGLYQIKVWMSEGDAVDTSKDPIITGTKGGDES